MGSYNGVPCKPWVGPVDDEGYGRVLIGHNAISGNPRYKRAHKAAYEEIHGPVAPNIEVSHLCDGAPACVEAQHLIAAPYVPPDWGRDEKWAEEGLTVRKLPPGTSIVWFSFGDEANEDKESE